MPKENLLFQLDNKEFQYHKLNFSLRYFNPRFHTTKLIKNANKNSKNSLKNKKKLKNVTLGSLFEELTTLKREILSKKLYRLCLKFNGKIDNMANEDKTVLKQLVLNRFMKSLKKKFKRYTAEYGQDLTEMDENAVANPFKNFEDWITEQDMINELEKNLKVKKLDDLSKVSKEHNKAISKLYQDKSLKLVMSEFEDGMDVFLNINRGSKKVERAESSVKDVQEEHSGEHDEYKETESNNDDYAQYDDMIGHSDDEEEYTAKRSNLPELEHGFIDTYDAESEEELEREIQNEKPEKKKKNRRGQRERRLIWEKKYGRAANHVQKKIEEETANKLERQKAYEERVFKRLEREQEYKDRQRAKMEKAKEYASKEFHPSWEAKRLQEEKTKNVKFQGKKVTF
ncbi:Protein bud22 [Hanseniaspora opuntiae]|uniref:Protein bud22 n=1 Tax=Hanseniaspora opuntiae TaxID=211096 RepID=A0A1E5RWQ1_9ASCO|nr:Protein bud22 [Hanseniaspora opuntiae]